MTSKLYMWTDSLKSVFNNQCVLRYYRTIMSILMVLLISSRGGCCMLPHILGRVHSGTCSHIEGECHSSRYLATYTSYSCKKIVVCYNHININHITLIIQVQEVLYYLNTIAEWAKRHHPTIQHPAARVTREVIWPEVRGQKELILTTSLCHCSLSCRPWSPLSGLLINFSTVWLWSVT